MNITREQREGGLSILKVVVGEADYGQAVEKQLREYKRKANVPGFRPGMVPMGIVKKMYGKHVVAEQSYHLASNSVFEYLQKENIDYIGDVIPAEEQGAFDFDNSTEFEFIFEIGEAPKYDVELSTKDKITYNRIKVDKKMHNDFKDNYLRRYGRLVEVDKVANDEALNVTLDNGDIRIVVGMATCGIAAGARPVMLGFIEELKKRNVGVSVHFIALHTMSAYTKRFGYKPEDFPKAYAYSESEISLPLYSTLSVADAQYAADAVLDIVSKYRR